MEPSEALEVRLSDVCRSCLMKTGDMTNFVPKTEQTSEIIAMLSSVGNIEIEINEFLPCYLCRPCEEKLRLSYDFQMLIQRSNEIIRECLNGSMVSGVDSPVEEKCDVVEDISGIKVEDGALLHVVNPVIRKASKSVEQFSAEEVEEVIREHQENYTANTECIKCGFLTTHSRALSAHMSRLHKDLKDRWCPICNTEVPNLPEHTAEHAETHFKCKFCGKKFNSGGHFYEHLRCHSDVKPHTCYICHRGFIAYRHLEKHLRVHMNNRLYKCTMCPANFAVRTAIREHLKQHSPQNGEVPSLKLLEFRSNPQNFCKICKKRVRSLEKHTESFHDPRSAGALKKTEGILCTRCGKKISCLSRFRLHMRTHTGEAPYKCQYCDKRMANRNHLVMHERTHTGEKPHVCTVCGRGFSQTSVLNTHMRIHTGRPFKCEICAKRFCRNAQLRLHMRKHTGEKPYQCDQCEQAFKQASHLTEHRKRHSGERPYKCSHCDKSFKQLSTLKSHLTIHTGEKPFKCSQCPYACRQRYSLTQHMKQHSIDAPDPEKPHFCRFCQKGYSTMAMLMSHNNLVHAALNL